MKTNRQKAAEVFNNSEKSRTEYAHQKIETIGSFGSTHVSFDGQKEDGYDVDSLDTICDLLDEADVEYTIEHDDHYEWRIEIAK